MRLFIPLKSLVVGLLVEKGQSQLWKGLMKLLDGYPFEYFEGLRNKSTKYSGKSYKSFYYLKISIYSIMHKD